MVRRLGNIYYDFWPSHNQHSQKSDMEFDVHNLLCHNKNWMQSLSTPLTSKLEYFATESGIPMGNILMDSVEPEHSASLKTSEYLFTHRNSSFSLLWWNTPWFVRRPWPQLHLTDTTPMTRVRSQLVLGKQTESDMEKVVFPYQIDPWIC